MSEKYNDENVRKILQSEKVPERLEPENIKKMLDSGNHAENRKKIRHAKILRIVSAAAAVAVVLSTSVYFIKPVLYEKGVFSKDSGIVYSVESMKPAAQYSDVYNYFYRARSFTKFKDMIFGGFGSKNYYGEVDIIEESASSNDGAVGDESSVMDNEGASPNYAWENENNNDDAPAYGSMESGSEDEQKNYSDTYSQETGVFEADIVKTDGNYIFYASGDTLCVSQVDSGNFINPYKTDVSDLLGIGVDGYIQDMYVYNGKLVVICEYYKNVIDDYNGNTVYDYYDQCYSNYDTYTAVFDISDKLNLSGYYVQEGNYNDVRLMADGYLYLVTNKDIYVDYDDTSEEDIEKYIPQYYVGEDGCCVPPENIMIPTHELKEVYNYISFVNVAGLDLNSDTPCQPVDTKSIAGYSNTIYCSQNNLYVVSGYDESEITRFAVSGGTITPEASGKVNGYVNDQFSMSEYNGYFRIAVTEDTWEEYTSPAGEDSAVASSTMVSQKNSVYVLDMGMNIVGSIGNFGLNEQIQSVNFNGDIAYVVTFRQTDPLYAIDLSDPANPVILDEFKITGYSSYMQYWSDGLLLGFGVEADEDTGWQTGIKLTMFDNSDPNNLQAIDSTVLSRGESGYVYSEAVNDRKALFIDPEKNLIGFPIEKDYETWADDYCVERYTEQSYQFYTFENNKFIWKGAISKDNASDNFFMENFRRVVYIDGYLYAVSDNEFKSTDAETFSKTSVVDFETN
ncbi:MAG: beta-propeller domain-containing protein [Oscillospiraceae bacterium]|nr:beta-propeller domain-containing protein [Oscillospiraceae bacterium]